MRVHTYAAAVGAVVVLLAVGGIAYATIPDSQGTLHACMLTVTGTIRLIDPSLSAQNVRSHCTALETPVSWSQRGPVGAPGVAGPPGPSGNSDSTVRHISNFMFDGKTVSTPIISSRGEEGKLSLSCGSDSNGGNGTITYTTSNTGPFHDSIMFYSPNVPIPATWTQVAGTVTVPWDNAPGDNIVFEILLESQLGAGDPQPRPLLTDIHGFVQHFDFGGCNFYVHVDTSDVASPETYTP